MDKLTLQEEKAMLVMWEIAPCCVKDMLNCYEEPRPPYTTLASIVKNLERKGYVKARRVGNTYDYTPLIEQSEYKRTFVGGMVRNYFKNSYKEMVSFFAREEKISAKELQEIIRLIEKEEENN